MRYERSAIHFFGPVCLVLIGFAVQTLGQTNGKIAFASIRDGNREIYVMDPDGSNQQRLTFNPLLDDNPAWSPDGRRIAFLSEVAPSAYEIKLMDADGSNVVKLHQVNVDTRLPSTCRRVSFSWSPDGGRIAFAENGDIYAVEITGLKPPERLTNLPECEYEPAWSPDGLTLAIGRGYRTNNFYSYISLISLAGGRRAQDVFQSGYVSTAVAPHWSPDGEVIISGFSGDYFGLVKGKASGRIIQWAFLPGVISARYSPDGRKLVFSRYNFSASVSEIWVADEDGTGERLVISRFNDYNPSWAVETTD